MRDGLSVEMVAVGAGEALAQVVMMGESDPTITASLGPIDGLICWLKSLEGSEQTPPVGLRMNQIRKLREHLEKFRKPLKSLSEMEETSFRAKWWMKEVRELCYDTDDYLVQSVADVHRLLGRIARFIISWNHSKVKWRTRVSRFMARAEVLKKTCETIIDVEIENAISLEQGKEAVIFLEREKEAVTETAQLFDMLGLFPFSKNNKKKLFDMLAFEGDKQPQLTVVIISGVAGSGKTTLARTLYVKCKWRFRCWAFVRVSRNPDFRSLLTSILSQIKAPSPHGLCDVQGLICSISDHLRGKRYFIVIDDVRNPSVWDIISRAFPAGNFRSRIIVTTQSEQVEAAYSGYMLKSSIFKMGATNDGCTLTSTKEKTKVLNIRYNNLPLNLKTCLLYLGMHPEGCTIWKDDLVKQWVAEVFIPAGKTGETSQITQNKKEVILDISQYETEEIAEVPQDGISEILQDQPEQIAQVNQDQREEIAGGYFDELVNRGMIQPVDINHKGEILSCTVHHLVLDLIRYKSKEDNFLVVVDNLQSTLGHPDIVRRLSVQFGCEKGASIPESVILSQVRSLTFYGFLECVPSFADYGLLRVLDLHIWADVDKIFDLTRIGELCYLRYLKIECNITVRLPLKIRRLQHLGTLELDAEVESIPSDIGHLKKLLHVRFPCKDDLRDLGELRNLLDLQLTCSTDEKLEDNMQSVLKSLRSLRSLVLVPASGTCSSNTLPVIPLRMWIVSPTPAHLQRLELSRRCCIFSTLPEWIGEIHELCVLKIAVRQLCWKDIDILKGLPSLTTLSLHLQIMAAETVFGKGGFSLLTHFKFKCNVPRLTIEADAMPNLEKLRLCFNSLIDDEQRTAPSIIIERLSGLKEISAINYSAGADAGSSWREAITNDGGNPEVQFMGSIYYDDQGREMVTREGSGEDENNEADIRVQDRQRRDEMTESDQMHRDVMVKNVRRWRVQMTESYRRRRDEMGNTDWRWLDEMTESYRRRRDEMGNTDWRPMDESPASDWKWSDEMDESNRRWRDEMDESNRRWRDEMDELDRERRRMDETTYIDPLRRAEMAENDWRRRDVMTESDRRWRDVMVETDWKRRDEMTDIDPLRRAEMAESDWRWRDEMTESDRRRRDEMAQNDCRPMDEYEMAEIEWRRRDEMAEIEWRRRDEMAETDRRRRDEMAESDRRRRDELTETDEWRKDEMAESDWRRRDEMTKTDRRRRDIMAMTDRRWRDEMTETDRRRRDEMTETDRRPRDENKQFSKYLDRMKVGEYEKPPDVKPQMNGLYEKDGIEPNAINAKYLEEILLANAASKRPEVVCIFGLHDRGKTVSATNVYEQIKGQFDYHLSVKVGKYPDMAQLIRNMIRQVKGTNEAGDVDQLKQILSQFFQKKRYLVMLDDLWSPGDWSTIESCFPQENPTSRIIITTTNEDAAKAAADHLYWIPIPVEANVEGLFSKEVPQWKDVEQMKQLIKVRYNGLSPDFRTCLLYLSIFPKKYEEIEIERLVRLWLALGFREPNRPIKEETARSCIQELIDRKLIEESSYEYDGTIRGCVVHPLIHEFIVCQATENQFLGLVLEEQRDVKPNYSKVRWLSVQNKSTKEAENYEATAHSINFFGQASGIPPLDSLTLLRVLDLEDYEGPVCLDGLLKLEFLRYLSLRGTNVSELPDWIGYLIDLQTLDVRSTKVKKLPPSIVWLENLMHLLAGEAELPPGISKMKALVTLSCASTMESSTTVSIKELGKIARLRELELFHGASRSSEGNSQPSTLKNKKSDGEKQVVFLSNGFRRLEKLSIHCSFTSVVFKTGALPKVKILELMFDKGVPEESAAVSIIQHLPSLERVIVKFSQGGADTTKTWDAVNTAAEDHRNEVSVMYGYKVDKHGFGASGKSVSRA